MHKNIYTKIHSYCNYVVLLSVILVFFAIYVGNAEAIAIKTEGVKEKKIKVEEPDKLNIMGESDEHSDEYHKAVSENARKGRDEYSGDDIKPKNTFKEEDDNAVSTKDNKMPQDKESAMDDKAEQETDVDDGTDKKTRLEIEIKDLPKVITFPKSKSKELKGKWIPITDPKLITVVKVGDDKFDTKEVKINEDTTVGVRATKRAKLFGIFDTEMEVEAILYSDGRIKEMKKPWWSFLLW